MKKVLLLVALVAGVPIAVFTEDLQQEFYSQGPPGWAQLARNNEQIVGKLRYVVTVNPKESPTPIRKIDKYNAFKSSLVRSSRVGRQIRCWDGR